MANVYEERKKIILDYVSDMIDSFNFDYYKAGYDQKEMEKQRTHSVFYLGEIIREQVKRMIEEN